MSDVAKQISELLFDHDCVIVPALGGFLASNQPSRILSNHTIFPPYRRIAFNVYLKQNDGLLANHFAEIANITYAQASLVLDSFTATCFETLDGGRKVIIPEVGTLFYDKEKNIQFEAFRNFNHLKDSFGMEAVHFLPLQTEEKPEKKKIQVEKLRPSISAKEEMPKSRISVKKVIGVVAIVAILGWFSLNLYMVAPKKYESTSMNPFDSQNIVLNSADSIRNIPDSQLQQTETVQVASVPVETLATTENIPDEIIVNKEEPIAEAIPKKIIPEPEPVIEKIKKAEIITERQNKHYVIAGVFKVRENALALLAQLQQLGFSNAVIIDANKCSYVSYDSYAFADEALSKVDSLHKNNLDGWVWRH